MNRLDSDAVQQGQAKTQEQKRKYRSTKKNLRSARKTQKQLQRRRLQLAEQMQDAERRLFDLFLDMQQLDHRLRSTPSVLHTQAYKLSARERRWTVTNMSSRYLKPGGML
jgi:chromosome segregation ATPase